MAYSSGEQAVSDDSEYKPDSPNTNNLQAVGLISLNMVNRESLYQGVATLTLTIQYVIDVE